MIKKAGFFLLSGVIILYCTGPFLWQFITSLKPDSELTRIPPILPLLPTSAHYITIFSQHTFLRIILNSMIVAASTTVLALTIGSFAAFGLGKLKIKRKTLILGFILSVSMFPPIATVSPLYIIIRSLGLRDTVWALIIGGRQSGDARPDDHNRADLVRPHIFFISVVAHCNAPR
jgi:multiple sugar transport system permease protein